MRSQVYNFIIMDRYYTGNFSLSIQYNPVSFYEPLIYYK